MAREADDILDPDDFFDDAGSGASEDLSLDADETPNRPQKPAKNATSRSRASRRELPDDDDEPFESHSRGGDRIVREVYASAKNIQNHGSPLDQNGGEYIRYYFYPTWRSQAANLLGFLITSILCIVVSKYAPILVVPGKLFSIGSTTIWLHFPVMILLPMSVLGKILINVYDAKYVIDEGGVEAQIGLVSFNLRQPRLRWEDIRGSEPQQTLWERMLGIGRVLVGSAMTQDVEITMAGIANPRAIQLLIQGERERRLNQIRGTDGGSARAARVHSAILED